MYNHYFNQSNQPYKERYQTSIDSIHQIVEDTKGSGKYDLFFQDAGQYILKLIQLNEQLSDGSFEKMTFEQLKAHNHALYLSVLGANYDHSFANPDKCEAVFGKSIGESLCYLYSKILNTVSFVFEGQLFCTVLNFELFIKMYEAIQVEKSESLKSLIYAEAMEALDLKAEVSVLRKCDQNFNTYSGVLMNSELTDLRYLFYYGHFIGDDEIKTAKYLLELPEEKIERMAKVCTEAFHKGYLKGHKEIPLSEKKTIQFAYPIGFERIVKKAAEIFAQSGLQPIVHNDIFTVARPRLMSTKPSEQYAYDHRFDEAIFFDESYAKALETVYAHYMEIHQVAVKSLAGIALQESFGQIPFSPMSKTTCPKYDEGQTSLKTAHTNAISKIRNAYYPASIWSFVIIAYPLPSIGDLYAEIFDEVIKVNTLDSALYETIHQSIIDALDQGEF
ncbi:MAG: hypothetical protein H7X94_02495, partial [Vallitaleaceae bacterium]|nr:hypothetical protein [Vallitaleaceae bacterium]